MQNKLKERELGMRRVASSDGQKNDNSIKHWALFYHVGSRAFSVVFSVVFVHLHVMIFLSDRDSLDSFSVT